MPWFAYAMIAWFVFAGCSSVADTVAATAKYKRPVAVAVGSLLVTLLLIWGTIALATG